jgi:hypothetical protein
LRDRRRCLARFLLDIIVEKHKVHGGLQGRVTKIIFLTKIGLSLRLERVFSVTQTARPLIDLTNFVEPVPSTSARPGFREGIGPALSTEKRVFLNAEWDRTVAASMRSK